jgi:uncharacterized protein YjbJ (UPF0337 family)
MSMSDNPDEIRRDIERTRRELSNDVDLLTEKVSPTKVMERRVERARGAVSSVKEKVMGSATDTRGAAGSGLGTAQDKVSSAASSVADTASSAPQLARQKAQGNPLAAGVIAFGAGWLLSSLLPASEKEQQAAGAIRDKASEHSDKLTGPLSEAAQQATDNLREPAQQAAESIKSTASDAASTVKGETQSATQDVAGQAKQATGRVSDQSGGSNGSPDGGPGSTYSR